MIKFLPKYFRNLFRVNLPDQKIRLETYQEINRSLSKAFRLRSLIKYAESLSIQGLLIKSAELFVGSRDIPKNIQLSRYLVEVAEKKANDQKVQSQIQYYKYFFLRIDAFKSGNTELFNFTTEAINQLADQKNHPQSCYLVGKQIYNIATETLQKKQQKQMFKLASLYFEKSLVENQYAGLFYIGSVHRNKQYSDVSPQQTNQFFIYGAAMGDPLCYFRMSQIYLQQKKQKLFVKYLKLAAEAGVIEAQHNLGCEYMQGIYIPKDQLKAFSWFNHASANGFIQSKYNIVHFFLQGSSCGRIKKNKQAALLKLQELKSVGQNVDSKIQQILQTYQIKKVIQQSK